MKVEEFFAQYEEDEQMMGQIIEASKDKNKLLAFLSSHGVAVAPTSARNGELSDEELSGVAGGDEDPVLKCLALCEKRPYIEFVEMCKKECIRKSGFGY